MIKAIIFDLDGVLVDTKFIHFEALNLALKKYKIREKFTRETISSFGINLHLIGPLQTNKVDLALSLFQTIQTVDREKLVNEIHKSIQKEKYHIRQMENLIKLI